MKFGKEFKKQMVPEWAEAYMDYNGLKSILRELREYKQSKQHPAVTSSRDFEQKLLPEGTLNGGGDVEDQVIDVNTFRGGGSKQFYKTKFLRQSEEGGEIEVTFFRKLDEELNKVNTFYKEKLEEVKQEASQLNKQMDALVALRIKVKIPHQDGSSSGRHDNVDSPMPLTRNTSALPNTSGVELRALESGVKANDKDQQEPCPGASVADPPHANISRSDSREVLHTYDYSQDPLEILEGVFKDSKEEQLSFDKEGLRRAEERLRVAFIEFYHKLQLLKHYSFMNLSAFSKIMKKYEKFSSRRASRSYMQIVDNSDLGNSDEVTNLMERVEATFIKNFFTLKS
ncbi:phosphate transporter PHO1 [Rosa sericea]